jgi:hypothetical protein
MGICGGQPSFAIAASAKQSSPHHTDPGFARGVQNSVLIRFYYKTMQAAHSSDMKS